MGETVPFNRSGDAAPANDDRIYSNEEVSEIIGIALRNAQTGDGTTVNHAEMLSIASEFGLSGGDIQRALDSLAEKEEALEIADKTALAFKLHVATYLAIIAGLFGINLISDPSYWWFLYPGILWGSIVVLHGIAQKYAPTAPWLLIESMVDQHHKGRGIWSTSVGSGGRATFYIDDVWGSFAEANGIAEIKDDVLVLEYEMRDSIFGALKSKVREELVPLDDIAGVRLQRGMWSAKLSLQGRRLSTFANVPTATGGEVTLVFKRENRDAAERLARELQERCCS